MHTAPTSSVTTPRVHFPGSPQIAAASHSTIAGDTIIKYRGSQIGCTAWPKNARRYIHVRGGSHAAARTTVGKITHAPTHHAGSRAGMPIAGGSSAAVTAVFFAARC